MWHIHIDKCYYVKNRVWPCCPHELVFVVQVQRMCRQDEMNILIKSFKIVKSQKKTDQHQVKRRKAVKKNQNPTWKNKIKTLFYQTDTASSEKKTSIIQHYNEKKNLSLSLFQRLN